MSNKDFFRELFKRSGSSLIELVGLILGLVGLYNTGPSILFNIFSVIVFFIIIYIIIFKIIYISKSLKDNTYPTKEKINSFMSSWLDEHGTSVIFSRDMSWAKDEEINLVLKKKAVNNELTVVLAAHNDISRELKELGATIIEYGYLDFVPETRFTIVDYGASYSKVAIGEKDDMEIHRINKYKKADAPVYYLASDLIRLIEKIEKNRNDISEENK